MITEASIMMIHYNQKVEDREFKNQFTEFLQKNMPTDSEPVNLKEEDEKENEDSLVKRHPFWLANDSLLLLNIKI